MLSTHSDLLCQGNEFQWMSRGELQATAVTADRPTDRRVLRRSLRLGREGGDQEVGRGAQLI